MGETKTQKRKLQNYTVLAQYQSLNSVTNDPASTIWQETTPDLVVSFPKWAPTQETTSYRTSGSDPLGEDPLSDENIKEFTDVTYNGFTEAPRSPRDLGWDSGHPFFTTKTGFHLSHPRFRRWVQAPTGVGKYNHYDGPLYPHLGTREVYPAIPRMSDNDIAYYGAKAIANSAPTKPRSSLTTAFGEFLSEGLPSLIGAGLIQNRLSRIRSSGSEYLNVQFGWLPLLSEIRSIATSLKNASATLRQFERDAGKRVRRSYGFNTQTTGYTEILQDSGQTTLGWFNAKQYDAGFFDVLRQGVRPNKLLLENSKSVSIWFKGEFQYFVPRPEGFWERIEEFEKKANILLGTSITPEVLWNLSPWSWLLDWSYNVGDLMSNTTLLADNGLVMRYGYLMRHTQEFNRFYIPDGATVFTGGASPGTISATFSRNTKERFRATPYGFALNPASFSAGQWAILGALGLTKAPKSLP